MTEIDRIIDDIVPVVRALVMSSGDTLAMRPPDQLAIATQLAQGGLRMHPEEATHHWDGADGLGLSAVWAPIGEAIGDAPTPDVSGLSLRQKAELFAQLKDQGFGGADSPPPPGGAEVGQ